MKKDKKGIEILKKRRRKIKFLIIFLTISVCISIFATFFLMIGIHSVDNSLNALIRYGNEEWFSSCDVIEYKIDGKGNFIGDCILFPQLYIFGLRIVVASAFLLFLGGVCFGLVVNKIERMLNKSIENLKEDDKEFEL